MIIVKLRKPFLIPLRFLPDEGGVWLSVVSIPGYTQPTEYSSDFDFSDVNQSPVEIDQVYIDNEFYEPAATEASMRIMEKSWFFIPSTQQLYIHVDHSKRMDSSEFSSQQIKGYSSKTVFYDENNIEYLPLLKTIPSMFGQVDRFVYQSLSLVPNSLEFSNEDGEFDYTFTDKIPGADVNVFFISSKDLADGKKTLTPIYTGYVARESKTTGNYVIDMEDKRGQLNGKIPNNYYSSTDFPAIGDSVDGKLIFEGYGPRKGVPAFCTNGALTSGDVTYKYATDGTALATVYKLVDGQWVTVTPSSSDPLTCTFTLSAANGRDGSGNPVQTKVDATLRSQINYADILADMIFRYLGDAFNSDNFNITEWGDERALLEDGGLLLDSREKFFDWVNVIQNGANLGFQFDYDASGKYTIKVDDITRAVSREIGYIENLADERKVDTDFQEYATDVLIKYGKDHESGEFKQVTVSPYREETLKIYRLEQEIELEVLTNSETQATERGNASAKDYREARDLHEVIIDEIIPKPLLDVMIYDSSVYLRGEKAREYGGNVKFKVAYFDYNFITERTTLRGYDISDIISKGTEIETQGYMYDDAGYGDDLFYAPDGTFIPEAG